MFTKKGIYLIRFTRYKHTFTKISNLTDAQLGTQINVKGWIKAKRNMKQHVFVDVNDGSCPDNLQLVIRKDSCKNLGYGVSIDASGSLSHTPQGKYELKTEIVDVIGNCPLNEGFPFTPKQTHPPEYIREHLHLRSRVSSMCSVFRVRHHATALFHNYLYKLGCIQVHTPIITTNNCEGGGEVFSVKPDSKSLLNDMKKSNIILEQAFFDRKTHLTVSGQLHLEAMCNGLGNVYTFNPAFRAENSKTPLHLAEFYMLEAELSFVQSIEDVSRFIENMFKDVTKKLLNICEADILKARQGKSVDFNWLDKPFPILPYSDAIAILQKNSSVLTVPVNDAEGLSKEHELFLTQFIGGPVFVIDWPANMKPFYMRLKQDDRNIAEALDFLVPHVGELAGGSVREDNYDLLKQKLPPGLEWYLDLRKYGSITTGGFGMGFERYLQLILGITNIKDVIPFPRWPHNCNM